MKRTENSNAFYYIKQLICLLQVCRLKQVIEVNGVELTLEDISKELKEELDDLRRNIVVPTLTMESDYSVIDLLDGYNRLTEAKISIGNGYHPSLEKAVKNTPDLLVLSKLYKDRFEEKGGCQDVRNEISSLINFSDTLFDDLYTFIDNTKSLLYFEQAIAWVNMLATVEFFFSVAEMGKTGFETEEDKEDNPWVE